MVEQVRIFVDDAADLQNHLRTRGVNAQRYERKGLAEAQMLIVALGGGAGIAASITALGSAIKSYFEGRAQLASASSFEIKVRDTAITVKGDQVDKALDQLRSILTK